MTKKKPETLREKALMKSKVATWLRARGCDDYDTLNMEEVQEIVEDAICEFFSDYLPKTEATKANEFIKDIAKELFGNDDIGNDGITWSIDDFKNALKVGFIRIEEVEKTIEETSTGVFDANSILKTLLTKQVDKTL